MIFQHGKNYTGISISTVLFMLVIYSLCYGEHPHGESLDSIFEIGVGVTSIYQRNVKGGLSTDSRKGEFSGSYDLEIAADLEHMFDLEGILYLHGEGGWTDSEGINGQSVGSSFGVNADAIGNRSLDIIEFFYEGSFFDDTFQLRIGKLDMTGGFECRGCPVSFDGSLYANDETSQFLNGALVNNPTIPFPDYGLGAIVHWNPIEHWYVSLGMADAQADRRQTGIRTTFHDEAYYLYMAETGITPHLNSGNGPLQGAYRFGLWYDPRPKPEGEAIQSRDDVGFYASFDQMLTKENSDPEDTQGMGVFFRYGYTDDTRNDMKHFYSFGAQYQGLIDGRDNDVFGLGFANGQFTDRPAAAFNQDHEGVIEAYYSIEVTEQLYLSPDVQYVINPGGVDTPDALVTGLRLQVGF